jgi:hypothetical protein
MPERGQFAMKKFLTHASHFLKSFASLLLITTCSATSAVCAESTTYAQNNQGFLAAHPTLKNFIFIEPPSEFSLGIGLIPVGVAGGRFLAGIDVFQLNWANSWLDWEILSTTIGFGFAQNSLNNSKHFIAATLPKLRLAESVSVGLMLGYESATFTNLLSYIEKDRHFTPNEPFSANSLIYGFVFSEYMKLNSSKKVKLSQKVFRENYSIDKTAAGWTIKFPQFQGDFDKTPISPSWVLLLEVSLVI